MLSSPQTITVNAVPYALSKINQDNMSSTWYFKVPGGAEYKMFIRHSYEGKAGPEQYERHNIELLNTTYLADGTPITRNAFMTIRKKRLEDIAPVQNLSAGLMTFVSANLAGLIGWEN